MIKLRIQLLGDCRLFNQDQTSIRVDDPDCQVILAFLALHPQRAIFQHELAQQMWPQAASEAALAYLARGIAHLHAILSTQGNFLTALSDTPTWQLVEPYTVDVDDFTTALTQAQMAAESGAVEAIEAHLTDAITLYQSEFLPQLNYPWVIAERRRLHERYLEALLQLTLLLERKGDYTRAVDYARILYRHSRRYEALHLRLAHLYVLNGSRAEQWRALEERLAVLLHAHGMLVLIHGVEGIGKSSMALACEERARQLGICFVIGRCYGQGVTAPFMPWQEVLTALTNVGVLKLEELPAPFGHSAPVHSAHQLIQSVAQQLVTAAAIRPLVLLLDDLHWADQDSLDLLDFVTRQLADIPLLILGTYRSEEIQRNHPLFDLLPTLQRNRPVEIIHLTPLTQEDTARLLAAYHGPCAPQLVRYLHTRAEGHPLFLVQLLNHLVEQKLLVQDETGRWQAPTQSLSIPALVQQVIVGRIARLGPQAEQFLGVAAVVGDIWVLAVVEAILGWSEEQILAVLENSLNARVITPTAEHGECYQFAHGLIREVLYKRQLARRRKHLHQQIATVLETHNAVEPAVFAYHCYAAEQWEAAYRYSLEAGDAARRRYAINSALRFYQQALAAAEKWKDGAPSHVLLQLYERLGEMYTTLNHKEEAVAAYTTIVEIARTAGDLLAEGRALSRLVTVQSKLYHIEHAYTTSQQALRVAQQVNDPHLLALSHLNLGFLYLAIGDMPSAWHHLKQSEQYARGLNEHNLITDALRYQGYLAIWSSEYVQAEHLLEEASNFAQKTHQALARAGLPFLIAFACAERGAYERARQIISEGLVYAEQLGDRLHYLAKLLNLMGYLYLEIGDIDAARQWNQRALDASRYEGVYYSIESACYALLDLATGQLWAGRLEAVLAYLAEFESIQMKTEYSRFRFLNRFQLLQAELALVRREFELALTYVSTARQHAVTKNMPKNIAKSLLYEGQALLGLGRLQEAVNPLQQAVALADQIDHAALRWQTRLRLAEAHAMLGQPRADLLHEALALVDALAVNLHDEHWRACFLASPLVLELRANARSATAPAQPAIATMKETNFPAGLTAREVEVLGLVAGGATNRQIAEVLHLSVGTVNSHLTHILNKIGCENRTAATAFALQYRLVESR